MVYCPTGPTLIPWKVGKSASRDITVVSTMAQSYTSQYAGVAAEIASVRKESEYVALTHVYCLLLVAIKTLGPLNRPTGAFILSNVGHRLSNVTGVVRETAFLFLKTYSYRATFYSCFVCFFFC